MPVPPKRRRKLVKKTFLSTGNLFLRFTSPQGGRLLAAIPPHTNDRDTAIAAMNACVLCSSIGEPSTICGYSGSRLSETLTHHATATDGEEA
jgi:hypothetical protein